MHEARKQLCESGRSLPGYWRVRGRYRTSEMETAYGGSNL